PGLLDRDQIDLATGSFDSRSSTLGRVVNLEGHLLGRKTFRTDQAHAVLRTADHTGGYQGSGINDTLGIELATVDIGLDAIDADFIEILRIPGIEAALGHTHVKGHLAAFKAVDRDTGASRLALAATTAGLANARTDTTTDTDANLVGAGIVTKFVQTSH